MGRAADPVELLCREHADLPAKAAYWYSRRLPGYRRARLLEDLEGAAALGLVVAARRFDRSKTSQSFRSYAWMVMIHQILDELRRTDYLSRGHRKLVSQGLLEAPPEPDSLEGLGSWFDDHGAGLHSSMRVPSDPDFSDELVSRLHDQERVQRLLDRLPERSREMLLLRVDEVPQREIARRFGLTESRVSQILGRLAYQLRYEPGSS